MMRASSRFREPLEESAQNMEDGPLNEPALRQSGHVERIRKEGATRNADNVFR